MQINIFSVSDELMKYWRGFSLVPQLVAGFGASIILLVTAFILIRRLPGVAQAGVDGTGILPSMWMAYKRPELQDRFLEVAEPTTDNLREVGMVEIQLADERHVRSTHGVYHTVSLGELETEVE